MATQVGNIQVNVGYSQNQAQYNALMNGLNAINAQGQAISSTLTTGFRGATSSIRAATSGVGALVNGFKTFLGMAIVSKLTQISGQMLEIASDATEVQNVVDVTFGEMSSVIDEFALKTERAFGVGETSAKQYAGVVGSISKSMGIAAEDVVTMSKNITALSGDMASFYNLSTDEAFSKLKSGLTGETEPLKALGIILSETNLSTFALSQGITKQYSAMSEAEKYILRYRYMLQQTADAQGDFARTGGSWSNSVKLLQGNISSLLGVLGKGLIVALLPVVKVLNTIIARLIQMGSAFVGLMEKITGKTFEEVNAQGGVALDNLASSAEDSFGAVKDASKDATKAIKKDQKSLASFDDVIQLKAPTDSSDASGAAANVGADGLSFGLGDITYDPDAIIKAVNEATSGAESSFSSTVDKINSKLAELGIEPINLNFDFKFIGQSAWNTVKNIIDTLKSIGHFVLDIGVRFANDIDVVGIITGIITTFESASELVKSAVNAITPMLTEFYEKGIAPIVQWVGGKLKDALSFASDLLKDWSQWFKDNTLTLRTFGGEIGSFVNMLWKIIEPIADVAWEVFKGVIKGISEVLQGLASWATGNGSEIISVLTGIATAIGVYKAIMAGISFVQFLAGLDMATIKLAAQTVATNIAATAQALWNTIISMNPIGLLIAIIAGLIAVFVTLWNTNEGFRDFCISAWEKIKEIFGVVVEAIKGFIGDMIEGFKSFMSYLGDKFGPAIEVIVEVVKGIFSAFVEKVKEIIGAFIKIFENIIGFFKNIFTGNISGAMENIKGIFSGYIDYLRAIFGPAFEVALGVVTGIFESVKEKFTNIIDAIKKVFSGVIDFITGVFTGEWGKAFEGLKSVVEGIFKGIANTVMSPFKSIITIWNSIVDKIGTLKIPDWVPELGGKGFNLPRIPMPKVALADGGIVTKTTYSMIGEAGAEAVIPLSPENPFVDAFAKKVASASNNTQPISLTIHIENAFGDDKSMGALTDKLVSNMAKKGLRVGGVSYVY